MKSISNTINSDTQTIEQIINELGCFTVIDIVNLTKLSTFDVLQSIMNSQVLFINDDFMVDIN